jgi:hypothetical protein
MGERHRSAAEIQQDHEREQKAFGATPEHGA